MKSAKSATIRVIRGKDFGIGAAFAVVDFAFG
jgi:hypothetical protein